MLAAPVSELVDDADRFILAEVHGLLACLLSKPFFERAWSWNLAIWKDNFRAAQWICHNAMDGEAMWSAMTQSYSAMRQKVLFWEKLDYIWHQRHCVSKQPWESNRQVGRSHRLPWANPVLPWEAANTAMRPQWGVGWGGVGGNRVKQPWKPSDRNLHTGIKNCP